MSNLNNDSSWTGTITLTKQSGTLLTLSTDDKYVDRDVELTLNATAATPSFSGGVASGNSYVNATNASISTSVNNSGIVLESEYSYSTTAVSYDGNVNGWVTESDGTVIVSSSSGSGNGTSYYLNGVTLTAPATGERTFTITVPNGTNDTITFTFNVDSNGNTTIE